MRKTRKILFSGLLFVLITTIYEVHATGLEQDIFIDLVAMDSHFEEGYLDMPSDFQEELELYRWLVTALNAYMTENGVEDVFSCDLGRDILYGSREFEIFDGFIGCTNYTYPMQTNNSTVFKQDSYKLQLQGDNHILYVEVDTRSGKVIIYPADENSVYDHSDGNPVAYQQIVWDEEVYYPDSYVESDWDDMRWEDDHFGEIEPDEIEHLDWLKILGEFSYNESVYFSVASALKRYREERLLEDVFYFDAEKGCVSNVTNMICTYRVSSSERMLYIDIDFVNQKCHVYEVEQ